ncbi:MAG: trypsin-like peptidase domain-containing protein, partial [Streptosporangiaceae bacterium]
MTAEAWRVAQLVVDRGPGDEGSRGSGYLVAPGLVLTAAHVVAGAVTVRVRLDVGQPAEVDVLAAGWWADPVGHHRTDLAVVMIAPDATAGREVEPARFGRISEGMAVLAVQAFGFPRFKLRGDAADGGLGMFRDLEQVTGHAPVAANRRQGTLAVYLEDPPPAAPGREGPSPWAGMSGAAVWSAGRIVGVAAEHHPGEGAGRLTARRIDRAYDELPKYDLGRLVDWLGLAPVIGGLPDVVPAGSGQFVRSAYLEQARDIAPDALIARDAELAQWAEFCAGPDRYAWWQAGPWAGKTALASWFVTRPPAGVDTVSFFVTGRLAGQADSDAFLEAMTEQLTALAPAGGGSPAVARARVGAWLSLLETAAAQAEERGRRLVVVVDGLDEDDTGAAPARGRPSIASLLPRRPPSGVRVIVTSRPDPGLPDDVPSGHPLATCIPHLLAVSGVAEDLARRAGQELRDLLGDQVGIDVAGYLAASGGGLARSDLEALTGVPPLRLDLVLRGLAGRSLQTRAPADSRGARPGAVTRVYLFAHETLRITAEEQLGAGLARYRERICDWIGSYAALGWPDDTPGYAIRGYPGLLTATSDVTRLSGLARDPRRHALLLRATGSDYAALAEIRTAQGLIADQKMPDLRALVELAVLRHAISIRNQSIPASLPAVWARLGHFDHAEALARTITRPGVQARALTELTRAATQAGDPDRAEALARAITRPDDQARALAELARAAAQAGDPDGASRLAADAEALARTITNPSVQARALTELARAAAQAGDPDRAGALARTITDPYTQALALTGLATAAAQAGDPDRAGALARTITDPYIQARALTELARAAAQAGDPDRA